MMRSEQLVATIPTLWQTWLENKDKQVRFGLPRNVYNPKGFEQRARSVYQARLPMFASVPPAPTVPPTSTRKDNDFVSIVCENVDNDNMIVQLSESKDGMHVDFFSENIQQATQFPKHLTQRLLGVNETRKEEL
jgi:hypothetical protein